MYDITVILCNIIIISTMQVIKFVQKLLKNSLEKFSLSAISNRVKLLLIIVGAVLIKIYFRQPRPIPKIPISELLSPLNIRALKNVKVFPTQIIALDRWGNLVRSSRVGVPSQMLFKQLWKSGANLQYAGNISNNSKLDFILFVISVCSSLLIYYFYKKNNHERTASKPENNVKFDDIVGLDSAKQALKQALNFMINPEKYKQRGARMRRGVLLYGPPGTGKTTLAKACANQAGIPFYSCNAAEFCEIYVGMGPKKVRQLFAKAKQTSPSVIFIDELDAFGSRSGENNYMMQSANSEKNSTINQILSQLDGFETNDKVLVIAATNRLQMVDKSLVRSGRFDLKIQVSLPTMQTKVKIFHKYLDKTKNTLTDQFIQKLLEKSQFCSGADIEALVNQAIYVSIRRDSSCVEAEDIINAIKQQQTN